MIPVPYPVTTRYRKPGSWAAGIRVDGRGDALAVGGTHHSVGGSDRASVLALSASHGDLGDTSQGALSRPFVGGCFPAPSQVQGGWGSHTSLLGTGGQRAHPMPVGADSLSPTKDGARNRRSRVQRSSCRNRFCSVNRSTTNSPLADSREPLTRSGSLVRSDKWAAWPDVTIRGAA